MAGNMLGEVDLLGLDEFGQNPGLPNVYGALIGAGIGTLTPIAARQFASPGDWAYDNAEWLGVGIGLAASAAMYAMPSTRHAALWSAAGVVAAAGLRAVAKSLFGAGALSDAMVQPLPPIAGAYGLGIPMMNPTPYVANPELGDAMISTVPPVYGASGLAGPQFGSAPPVNLVGNSLGAQQAQLLGGPLTDGLSKHYGVTLFEGAH